MGGSGKVYAYHTFGLAMTHLKDTAKKTPVAPCTMRIVAGVEKIAKAFAVWLERHLRE